MINQCSSCGGFCKKSGCERENVKPTPQRTWVGLTEEEQLNVFAELIAKPTSEYEVYKAYELALKDKNTRGQE